MNFIIDNYTTNEDTQALYFHNSLSSFEHKSKLFDPKKESLYDVFDTHNPDIYITHGYRVSQDLIHYLHNNEETIDVLINIQSMKLDDVNNLSSFLFKNNIHSSFFFLNVDQNDLPKIKDRNIINVLSAADTNLLNQKPSIEYKMKKGVIVNDRSQIKDYKCPHHYISTFDSNKDFVDFMLPEIVLAPLFKCYETIIFRSFNGYIPQAFFDAIMFGCKVYFDLDDKKQQDNINNLLTKMLKIQQTLDFKDGDRLQEFESLKTLIMDKHTNVNRVRTLLSNIKVKQ